MQHTASSLTLEAPSFDISYDLLFANRDFGIVPTETNQKLTIIWKLKAPMIG